MGKPRHTAEQIIAKLREAEVLQGKGMLLEEVLRQVGISDATYYPRSTQRRKPVVKSDEEALRQEIVATACAYGRYGYRRVTALLRNGGWRVNHKRVERIWRQEGLKVPKRQPKRRRLWLNDGSCIRLRPEYANHVWSYDFVAERTSDGKALRMLNIMDEYTRECLRIHIGRQVKATDVIFELSELFIERGAPDNLRSDNGSEFTSDLIREWLGRLGVKTLFIEPGSPWENGYIDSFNGKLRDELLNGEIFDTILEARVVTEDWRQLYNTIRPHSSLGYRAPRRKHTPYTRSPMPETGKKRTQYWYTNRGQVRWEEGTSKPSQSLEERLAGLLTNLPHER